MAFASGPVSFQRFYLSGRIAKDLTEEMLKNIAARAFGRNPALSDNSHYGWIGSRHLFETTITGESVAFGSFLHMALRIDKLKPPGSVVKAYIQEAEETAKQAGGREFLSKGEKKKCRETALLRAEQEAKDGAFRRMSAYPVLIDLANKRAYLANTGTAIADVFMKLFADTFGGSLEPATPETVARRIVAGSKNPAALDNLTAFRLTKPPEGYSDEESAIQFQGDVNFLGKELLTWLWHETDGEDGRLKVADGDEITVMLDRMLRLKCDYGLTGVDVLTADGVTSLPEARAALRIGKQPVKAGLVLGAPHGEFRLTLDATRMTITGLTLPEEKSERDRREQMQARFELIDDAADLIDALYEQFIIRRISRDWQSTQREMAAWAGGESRGSRRMTAAG